MGRTVRKKGANKARMSQKKHNGESIQGTRGKQSRLGRHIRTIADSFIGNPEVFDIPAPNVTRLAVWLNNHNLA